MKKLLAMMLAVVMVFGLAACRGETPAEPTVPAEQGGMTETAAPAPSEETEREEARVALITDYGDITDQSFNQTTYEACKDYCDSNDITFTYYKPLGNSTADRVAMVHAAAADGYNIMVMPGYTFGGTIVETCEMYPEIKFIALDVALDDLLENAVSAAGEKYSSHPEDYNLADYVDVSNVYCATYQEELSGYMAGYAAVKMGYRHLGFLGGMPVPAVMRYGYGYVQGINAAAEEQKIADQVTLEYIYGNQFSGDADITAVMDTWYGEKGVEIVFACGGGIFTSAGEAAAKSNGKIIGVDVDQSAIIDGVYGEGMTVTSATKGLAPTVRDTLEDIIEHGNWSRYAGRITTLGLVSEDPEENYVQIPMTTTQWTGDFSMDDYRALVRGMVDGNICVSGDISEMPSHTITVNEHGNIK